MGVRRLYQTALATGIVGILSAPAAFASAGGSTTYYGLLSKEDGTIVAELECALSSGSCTKIATNKVARVTNSPDGDLMRVSGRFRDRRSDSKAAYVKTVWYGGAQACVTGTLGIDGGSGVSAQLCSNWVDLNVTKSTGQVSRETTTAYQNFSLQKTFGPAANAMRVATYVCVNNTLWFSDICSGSRLLTANV